MSVVMTASLTDLSPKFGFKLSRKFLQPRLVANLFRLAIEMSSLLTNVNWLKLLKTEVPESVRQTNEMSDLVDSFFASPDRRSSRYE